MQQQHFPHHPWLRPESRFQHETCALVVTLSLVLPYLFLLFLPPPLFCSHRICLSLAKPLYLFIFFFLFFFSLLFPPVFVCFVNSVTRKAANSNVLNSLTLVQACQVLEWLIRLCAVLVFLQQQGYKSESTVQTEAFFLFSLGYFPHSLCVCACPVLFSREQAQIPIKETTNTAPAISATFYFLFLSQRGS